MYWNFGAIAFRLRDVEGQDFSFEQDAPTVNLSSGALFVVLPVNAAELPQIQSAFPDGTAVDVYSDANGRLLFSLYEIPARRAQ
jgi:hypothetical protein